jgi:hypothetical protein
MLICAFSCKHLGSFHEADATVLQKDLVPCCFNTYCRMRSA